MKPSILFLFLFIVCACNPDFHKQKYTNFGHGKALKMKTGISDEKETVWFLEKHENTALDPETVTVQELDVHPNVDSVLVFVSERNSSLEDTLPLILREDSLKIASVTAADSLKATLYSRQLKREATRNLMLGVAEIAIGILAFFFLPYWLPVLIVHVIVGVLFMLVASHKIVKSNEVIRYPGRYKNPGGTHRLDDSLMHLSHIGYVLLLLSIVIGLLMFSVILMGGNLIYIVLALIAFYIIPVPLALIALILLVIAGLKGRNYVREENLQNLPPTSRMKGYNAINWSIIAIAFTTIVTSISHLFGEE